MRKRKRKKGKKPPVKMADQEDSEREVY